MDATGGDLHFKTDQASMQEANTIVLEATGSCTTSAVDIMSYLPSTPGCILLSAPTGLLGGKAQMVLLESMESSNPSARLVLDSGTQTAEISTISSDYSTGSDIRLNNG